MVSAVLEAVADYALLLDARRQILFANAALCRALGAANAEALIGRRVGDVLGCERACTAPNGCGTSQGCARCGALLTLLSARDAERTVSGHCVMSLHRGEGDTCVEFSVRVTRTHFDDEPLWICLLSDVTATRRRELLERLFLHDSRNVLQGLLGWGEWLHQNQPSEAASQIVSLAQRLSRELEEQQLLSQAELGTLLVQRARHRVRALLASVVAVFAANECAKERVVRIEPGPDGSIVTDERLLVRVLVNLVQNAVEATPVRGTVSIAAVQISKGYRFVVSNPGEISKEVAQRLLHVGYSTKGAGRGLGSHAVRLFGEGCLGGKLSFESDGHRGTRFYFELPKNGNAQDS
jgi:nitrogen-specific signal transduction histidine kinase